MKEKSAAKSSDDPLAALREIFQPMLDFHKPVDGAEDEDVRIFWDVRCIRGTSETLAHLTGSSTMSGILSDKMMPEASALIIREIDVKIAQPLAGKFQNMAEEAAEENSLPKLTLKDADSEGPEAMEIARQLQAASQDDDE